jgi:formate-nitrite transporter family protein
VASIQSILYVPDEQKRSLLELCRPVDFSRGLVSFCPYHPARLGRIQAPMPRPAVKHDEELGDETRRLTAPEIFHQVVEDARSELRRSNSTLAFSGLAGGLTLGLTALSVAAVRDLLGRGGWQDLVSYLAYPIGFIAVIIGRAQLFTENTLYPVILVLDERRHLWDTLRLWGVVLASNLVGATLFALLAVKSGALRPGIANQLMELGTEAVQGPAAHIFWSGVIGGWLIALVAWVVTASQWTIGQLAMVWILTFVVGVGKFSHCVVTSGEIISAILIGPVTVGAYLQWLLLATAGNIVGGVVIVSVLNYGQVREM